jgi:hypothetical protein
MGPVGAVGVSASIKWLTKDGLGAAGRLFVGGRLSTVFDEDPKRWRLNAELVNSGGLALEIATQLFPSAYMRGLCSGQHGPRRSGLPAAFCLTCSWPSY